MTKSRKLTIGILIGFSCSSFLLVPGWEVAQASPESKAKRMINKERKKRKRPRLRNNGPLKRASKAYSKLQKRMGKTGHMIDGMTPTERAVAKGFGGTLTGEAIANAPTPDLAVGFWKQSREHKKIIMDKKATVIGIGKAGRIWTAMLGNRTPPPAP